MNFLKKLFYKEEYMFYSLMLSETDTPASTIKSIMMACDDWKIKPDSVVFFSITRDKAHKGFQMNYRSKEKVKVPRWIKS